MKKEVVNKHMSDSVPNPRKKGLVHNKMQ